MQDGRGLSGTCLYHEGPSGHWVLDQLHLPRSRRHQSRHRLVPGAPGPKPQPPISSTEANSLPGREEGRLQWGRVCSWPPPELTSTLPCSPPFVRPAALALVPALRSGWEPDHRV